MADDATKVAFSEKLAQINNFTDFTLLCNGREWRVNRNVLSAHSRVFHKALTGSFKEASDRLYDFTADHEIDEIDALVQYLYHFDYDRLLQRLEERIDSDVRIAICADKYQIDGLMDLATKYIKEALVSDIENVFEKAIEAIYATERAPPELRKAVLEGFTDHRYGYVADHPSDETVEQMVLRYPQFSLDLAQERANAAARPTVASEEQLERQACLDSSCGQTIRPILVQKFAEPDTPANWWYRCPSCRTWGQKFQWDSSALRNAPGI